MNSHIRNSPFTSIVPNQAGPGPHGTNTGDIDDASTASLLQSGHGSRQTQVDALDVDGEDPVELVLGDIQRRLVLVAGARVVDHDV